MYSGLVLAVYNGRVLAVCNGLVLAVCNGRVLEACNKSYTQKMRRYNIKIWFVLPLRINQLAG